MSSSIQISPAELISSIISPMMVAAFVWFIVRKYFTRQEQILDEVAKSLEALKVRLAVHESQVEQLRHHTEDISRMKEELVVLRQKVEAAWTVLDRVRDNQEKNTSEIHSIKQKLSG